jgi:hypothetical protein
LKRVWQYSIVAVLVFFANRAEAQVAPSGTVRLTVCLMDDAGLTDEVVGKVERRVDELFAPSGIALRWLRGGDPGRTVEERWACEHPEVLQRVVIRWMKGGLLASPNELGEAFLDADGRGVIADLFLDKMERIKTAREVDFTVLLAHLTAHELGHLLLGGGSHSVSGLMEAKVSEEALRKMMQGNFGFSRTEQKRMHARMKAAEVSAMLARNRPNQFGN